MGQKHGNLAGLGGWLYADLLLILFIGVLIQLPSPKPKIAARDSIATITPTPEPTLTSTARPTVLARIGRERLSVSLRSTPSMSGAIQGEMNSDSFVYVLDRNGEWASVVITSYIKTDVLRDPSDPVFLTPPAATSTPETGVPLGPTPTATALPSLREDRIVVQILVPPSLSANSPLSQRLEFREKVIESLEEALVASNLPRSSEVGMVLSFGGAPNGQPSIGNDTSRRVNDVIRAKEQDDVADRFSKAGFEKFHSFSVAPGKVELWIYVYVN
jgi:hypothetical protein